MIGRSYNTSFFLYLIYMKHHSSHEALKKQAAKPEMLYQVTISAGRSPNMRTDGMTGLTQKEVQNYVMNYAFPNFMDPVDGLQIDIVSDYFSMQERESDQYGDQYSA